MLEAIHTGYPRFKLADEVGIPRRKIRTFPWLYAPYMARSRVNFSNQRISRRWAWWAHETLDWKVSSELDSSDALIALSGSGLRSGRWMRQSGKIYICDRGSSHIRFQDQSLREEYARWGLVFAGVDPRILRKEEQEYEIATRISVPSEFVQRSFLAQGVPAARLAKIPYGARFDRFRPVGAPSPDKFVVLYVGAISVRKGFLYLLKAFQMLKHPQKRLQVIGHVCPEMSSLLARENLEHVDLIGAVPNAELANYYSCATVFVLPSIEDGFGMVMGEAMACGCPVIATENTGADDLFDPQTEGWVVPIRSPKAIHQRLEELCDDPDLRQRVSKLALDRIQRMGGWDEYGDQFAKLLNKLNGTIEL